MSSAIQTRGSVAPPADVSNATTENTNSMARLESAFNEYATKVDTWTRILKVQNVVTETEDALKILDTIREESDV